MTHNAYKVREIGAILSPVGVEVLGLDDLPKFEVEEDGDSFEANAEKKARSIHQWTDDAALADDSGLVVDLLGGAPGIHSARYAGGGIKRGEQDAANRVKLHAALAGHEKPKARFICVLAYVEKGKSPLFFRGEVKGTITASERGTFGFGYDAMFEPVGSTRTFAEYSPAEKNAVSHRAKALQALMRHLAG
ncbi:MAG: RdgB/HAM1 family non-canonical purine NTP pyrophosphatase [Myxococcota bacterium]|nr:RdgB/HAM1 family non-canonical purine NTP pyrophosphatase [Myxococcota bacterium]